MRTASLKLHFDAVYEEMFTLGIASKKKIEEIQWKIFILDNGATSGFFLFFFFCIALVLHHVVVNLLDNSCPSFFFPSESTRCSLQML